MIFIVIAAAVVALGEIAVAAMVAKLDKLLREHIREEKRESFTEAVADILSYDLERAKESARNE